jgi:hypothetical protein
MLTSPTCLPLKGFRFRFAIGAALLNAVLFAPASAAVTTVQKGAKLTITGDNVADDRITVFDDGFGGTVVDGVSGPHVGITDIVIDGRGGDESIEVRGMILIGSLEIKTGVSVTSSVSITSVGVHGKTTVDCQAGRDSVLISGCTLSGDVKVETGDGAIGFLFNSSSAFNVAYKSGRGNADVEVRDSIVAAKLTLTTSDGMDEVDVVGSSIGVAEIKTGAAGDQVLCGTMSAFASLKIDAGSGENLVGVFEGCQVNGDLTVKTADGRDGLTLGNGLLVTGKLTVETGAGNDDCTVGAGAAVGGIVAIKTADGGDDITFIDVDLSNKLIIETGNGVDGVMITDIEVDGTTSVKLGGDNDTVAIFDGKFDLSVTIDGGSGAGDSVFEDAMTDYVGGAIFPNVEIFP